MKRIELIGALYLIVAPALSGAADRTQAQEAGTVLSEVKVRDLNRNPGQFSGQDVVVRGKVSKVEGAKAFVVEGSGFFNNEILVIVAQPRQQAGSSEQQMGALPQQPRRVLKEKDKVQLTGRVETLGITQVEEKYRPGLKAEVKAEFEGDMPILVVSPGGIKQMS